ncbi:unnamed protein product, partial [Amoebophrya sp. A25]
GNRAEGGQEHRLHYPKTPFSRIRSFLSCCVRRKPSPGPRFDGVFAGPEDRELREMGLLCWDGNYNLHPLKRTATTRTYIRTQKEELECMRKMEEESRRTTRLSNRQSLKNPQSIMDDLTFFEQATGRQRLTGTPKNELLEDTAERHRVRRRSLFVPTTFDTVDANIEPNTRNSVQAVHARDHGQGHPPATRSSTTYTASSQFFGEQIYRWTAYDAFGAQRFENFVSPHVKDDGMRSVTKQPLDPLSLQGFFLNTLCSRRSLFRLF